MKYISVAFLPSSSKGKRLKAVLRSADGKTKTINFGSASGQSFVDHKDSKKKEAWIARHKVREDWSVPDTAGSLAKHILWETPSLANNKKLFARKFSLKLL